MERYMVQVLTDKEFDNLPYRGISDSLGIADKEKGLAFVRQSGLGKEFDLATLTHEVNHLIETHATDVDKFGIMHKKFTEVLSSVAAPVVGAIATLVGHPYVGALLSTALSTPAAVRGETAPYVPAIQGGAQLLGGALGAGQAGGAAYTTAREAGKGFIASGGQALKAGVGQLLGMTPAAGLATYPAGTPVGVTNMGTFSQFPSASAANLATAPLSTAPQTLGIGQSILGSAVGAGIGSQLAGGQVIPSAGQVAPTVAPTVEKAAPKTSWLGTLSKKTGEYLTKPETLLGGGLTLASMAGKQPEYPELPVDIENIRSSLLSGQAISPLGQQARAQLSQIMAAQSGQLYPTATDAYYQSAMRQTEIAYQRAQEALAKRYNLIDPNYLQSGEYQELARRLDEELANVKSDYAIQEEQRRFELSRQQQYQAIRDALNVSDADMQELLGFTKLTVEQAAEKYKVAAADVEEIRKALGGIGGQLLAGSLTKNTAQTMG